MALAARGRGTAGDTKVWRDAIRIAAMAKDKVTGRRRLQMLAERLMYEALNGDVSALKEIGDRLDGKAMQPTEGTLNVSLSVDAPTLAAIRERSRAAR